MTWSRSATATALADALSAVATPDGVAVFDHPPATLNVPALVVGRPIEVLYSVAGLGVDDAQLPVICLGPALDGEGVVDELIGMVRLVVATDPTLGQVVRIVTAPMERNWRAVRVGGADFLAADVVLQIQQ